MACVHHVSVCQRCIGRVLSFWPCWSRAVRSLSGAQTGLWVVSRNDLQCIGAMVDGLSTQCILVSAQRAETNVKTMLHVGVRHSGFMSSRRVPERSETVAAMLRIVNVQDVQECSSSVLPVPIRVCS
jgi:hypothetical protein